MRALGFDRIRLLIGGALLVGVHGCAVGEPVDVPQPDGGSGTGQVTSGTGGNASSGTGGAIGTGGVRGTGGVTGTGGTSGVGGTGGTAPTFTEIYGTILTVYCAGSQCHDPGNQNGVAFSTQAGAYSSLKSAVTPGNGANSTLYILVNDGAMPPGGPKLSAANLALIKAWIDAGALNN